MLDDDPLYGICLRLAELVDVARDRTGEDPREIRMTPRAYRSWRNAGGGDDYLLIPIRVSERLPAGSWALAPW